MESRETCKRRRVAGGHGIDHRYRQGAIGLIGAVERRDRATARSCEAATARISRITAESCLRGGQITALAHAAKARASAPAAIICLCHKSRQNGALWAGFRPLFLASVVTGGFVATA